MRAVRETHPRVTNTSARERPLATAGDVGHQLSLSYTSMPRGTWTARVTKDQGNVSGVNFTLHATHATKAARLLQRTCHPVR